MEYLKRPSALFFASVFCLVQGCESGQDTPPKRTSFVEKVQCTQELLHKNNHTGSDLSGKELIKWRTFCERYALANFSDAKLKNASFDDSDFNFADFSRAILIGSSIRASNFKGANFDNADVTDVWWEDVVCRDGKTSGSNWLGWLGFIGKGPTCCGHFNYKDLRGNDHEVEVAAGCETEADHQL